MPAAAAGSGKTKKKKKYFVGGKYELFRFLGRGAFAEVYAARSVADGEVVAAKVLNSKLMLKNGLKDAVLKEIEVLKLLRHPHITRLREVLATRSRVFLISDIADGGDLLARLMAQPEYRINEHVARRVLLQLTMALRYCHARGVAHRDVKAQNVLLDKYGNVLLSDFGLAALPRSRRDDGLLDTPCGTPAYVAPEVFLRQGYDGPKADAWSCGVLLFLMLAGSLPFNDTNTMVLVRKMRRQEYHCPPWISPTAKKMITKLLDPDPASRLPLEELMTHPWFQRSLSLDSQLGELLWRDGWQDTATFLGDKLNAFHIISRSSDFNLSGLLPDCNTMQLLSWRFMSASSPKKIVEAVIVAGVRLGFTVTSRERRIELDSVLCCTGTVILSLEILELSPELKMVEIQVDGDVPAGLAFVLDDLKLELEEIVLNRAPDTAEPNKELKRSASFR